MKFWYQAKKAKRKSTFEWYKFYSVSRYGAPGRLEFICPDSGMVAKTIQQEEAISHRNYWANCAVASEGIVNWLDSINADQYTARVHSYLLSLLIVRAPILREVAAYEKRYPRIEHKPWQTTGTDSV